MTWLALAYFYICAAFAVSGALAVALAKNAIRGAMGLLLLILSMAGLFLSLRAQFLALIQLIVYAGAVVILFLFVIMLLGPSADPPHDHRGRVSRGVGAAVFGLAMLVAILPLTISAHAHPIVPASVDFGSIDSGSMKKLRNRTRSGSIGTPIQPVGMLAETRRRLALRSVVRARQ